MASYNKIQQFVEDLALAVHNLSASGGHTLKVMLTLTAPLVTNEVKADLTEIAAGNGYTAGGTATVISSMAHASGTLKMVCSDVVFTAVAGSFADFRYATLFNDSPTAPLDPLIAFWDYGSTLTLRAGETFTVDFDATNGVFQLV